MSLQDMLASYGCTVLNYTGNRIEVSYFYSGEMYKKYLAGADCMQGMGLRNLDEKINFNILPDGVLVVVQRDGIEETRYKFETIIKATVEFTYTKGDSNSNKRSLTFHIRKQEYLPGLNYIEVEGKKSLIFDNLNEIKENIINEYGAYKVKSWDVL